jgi:hypothetical protein
MVVKIPKKKEMKSLLPAPCVLAFPAHHSPPTAFNTHFTVE